MTTHSYGPHAEQRLRLTMPASGEKKAPLAVLFHGGYWKQQWTVDNTPITSIVPDLLAKGFGVAEVEYRRRDDKGGGWPGTNEDALLALNSLRGVAPAECAALDLDDVTLIGHSAGGCLVLWLAAQELPVRLTLVVAVAPVCDLSEGYFLKVSDEGDAVERYMKCTPETDEGLAQYARASPAELIPRIEVHPVRVWAALMRTRAAAFRLLHAPPAQAGHRSDCADAHRRPSC